MNKSLFFHIEKIYMGKINTEFRRLAVICEWRKNLIAEKYIRGFKFFLMFDFSPWGVGIWILGIYSQYALYSSNILEL